MRCRLILLISEHPIQQVIRKGGGPHFWDRRGEERTDEDRMAYSRQLDWYFYLDFSWWCDLHFMESGCRDR